MAEQPKYLQVADILRKEIAEGVFRDGQTLMTEEELRSRVKDTFEDPECGKVMRVKGFVRTDENTLMQINATENGMEIEPTVFAREVLIVTGEYLNRERIDGIWAAASEIITPGKTTAGL